MVVVEEEEEEVVKVEGGGPHLRSIFFPKILTVQTGALPPRQRCGLAVSEPFSVPYADYATFQNVGSDAASNEEDEGEQHHRQQCECEG